MKLQDDPPTGLVEPQSPTVSLWRGISNDEYHADHSAIGSSMLKTFRKSPARYHGLYVDHSIPPDEPTPDMVLGSALHCLVLEPDEFTNRYVLAIHADGRTKEGKAAKALFAEQNAGKVVLTMEQWNEAHAMLDAIERHPAASRLLSGPGANEVALRMTDPEFGLTYKVRLDRLILPPAAAVPIVIDLKSAVDPSPEPFARAAVNLGYPLQAALYSMVAEAMVGVPPVFLLVAVGKEEPNDVWVHQPDAEFLGLGRRQLTETVTDLLRCADSGEWTAKGQNEINPLCAPRWAL